FLSGLRFPSAGTPGAAVQLGRRMEAETARYRLEDRNDARARAEDLMTRCAYLPALSQTNPSAGLAEFAAIRGSIASMEAAGQAGAFDRADYGNLAIGGIRARRLLGRNNQAAAEARDGIKRILEDKQHSSPAVAHVENTMRFELALLNEGG